MHDLKTRRRWPPRSPQWRKYPPQTTLRRNHLFPRVSSRWSPLQSSLPILTLPLDSSRCLSSPASPPSKSPLFIANGFRIMMPGWLRDPIQIPRVSSSGPARFLPPLLAPLSLFLPPPTLFVHGVVIAGGVIALARDLSNNLLCTIPPRHTTTVRSTVSLSPSGSISSLLFFLFLSFFFVRVIEDRKHSAGRSEKLSGS